MKTLINLKSKEDLIVEMKEIFVTARYAQMRYKKGRLDLEDLGIKPEEYETFSDKTKDLISNLFDYSMSHKDSKKYDEHLYKTVNDFLQGSNEDKQIEKLKIIIEGIVFKEFDESKKYLIEAMKEMFLTASHEKILGNKGRLDLADLGIKPEQYNNFSDETKSFIKSLLDYSMSYGDLKRSDDYLNKLLDEFLKDFNEEEQIEQLIMITEWMIFKRSKEGQLLGENKEDIKTIKDETKGNAEQSLKNADEKTRNDKIKKELERIKNIIESEQYIKGRYSEILKKEEQLMGKKNDEQPKDRKNDEQQKDRKNDEQIIVDFLKKSKKMKVYIDQEKQTDFNYGVFLENGKEVNLTIYRDETICLKRIANYITGKATVRLAPNESVKVVKKISEQKVARYRFSLMNGKKEAESVEFFADESIGDRILMGNKKALDLMLAALCEASEQKRAYIGKISCIDRELGTFITTYDDNLEDAVQEILMQDRQDAGEDAKDIRMEKRKFSTGDR